MIDNRYSRDLLESPWSALTMSRIFSRLNRDRIQSLLGTCVKSSSSAARRSRMSALSMEETLSRYDPFLKLTDGGGLEHLGGAIEEDDALFDTRDGTKISQFGLSVHPDLLGVERHEFCQSSTADSARLIASLASRAISEAASYLSR